jgi:hypothetical protein
LTFGIAYMCWAVKWRQLLFRYFYVTVEYVTWYETICKQPDTLYPLHTNVFKTEYVRDVSMFYFVSVRMLDEFFNI